MLIVCFKKTSKLSEDFFGIGNLSGLWVTKINNGEEQLCFFFIKITLSQFFKVQNSTKN